MKITDSQFSVLKDVANALNVSVETLYKLIDSESGWNPTIKNPVSSAIGLIQLTDKAAHDIGFKTSLDAIKKYPTIELQLKNVVLPFLRRYRPYKNDADLLLQVFFPAARRMHPMDVLPDTVRKVNPGISTPYDYVLRALRDPKKAIAAFGKKTENIVPVLLIIGVSVFLLLKKG